MPGVVGDAKMGRTLPTLRELPRELGEGGDVLHGKQAAWVKSMCFDITSNGTNRSHMLPDVMHGEGHIITSGVCWPKTHNLKLIRENISRAQTWLSSKMGRPCHA